MIIPGRRKFVRFGGMARKNNAATKTTTVSIFDQMSILMSDLDVLRFLATRI